MNDDPMIRKDIAENYRCAIEESRRAGSKRCEQQCASCAAWYPSEDRATVHD